MALISMLVISISMFKLN